MPDVQQIVLSIAAERGCRSLYKCDQSFWTVVFERVFGQVPMSESDTRFDKLFSQKRYAAMSFLPDSTGSLFRKGKYMSINKRRRVRNGVFL